MRTFLVENTRKGTTIKVTLHQPPYENEDILSKTGYKVNDVIITDITKGSISLTDYRSIDNEYDEQENSLMGKKKPKKKKIKEKK